jgi:hypothetical protein
MNTSDTDKDSTSFTKPLLANGEVDALDLKLRQVASDEAKSIDNEADGQVKSTYSTFDDDEADQAKP